MVRIELWSWGSEVEAAGGVCARMSGGGVGPVWVRLWR